MAEASASFQLKVGAGSYQPAGTAVNAVEGDVITAKLVSVAGINGDLIEWTVFGTHGASAPALTESGSPSGQEVSFTVPSGLAPGGGAFGLQSDVNGGSSVTGQAATTSKSAVFVLNASGNRPFFHGQQAEADSTYLLAPQLNQSANPAVVNTTSIDNTDSPYTALAADRVILVDTSSAAVTVNLPAASTATGRIIMVKDSGGNAATNNITVDGNASETIDGSATYVLSSNYLAAAFLCTGTAWLVI